MRFRDGLMSASRVLGFAFTLAVALSAQSGTAGAQSFFEMLFGGGPKPAAPKVHMLTPGGQSYQAQGVFSTPWPKQSGYGQSPMDSGGKYRTLCVRLCDGYYYPIRSSATRADFMSDQMRCSATCGADARLFYVAARNPEMNDALDMSGRPYAGLPNAFRYRKSLVAGCQCRPEPWSQAEVARHRRYAEAEAVRPRPHREIGAPLAVAAAAPVVTPTEQQIAAAADDAADPVNGRIVLRPIQADRAGATAQVRIHSPDGVRVVTVNRTPHSALPGVATPKLAKPVRIAARRTTPPPKLNGGMALGAGTMVWPGDAPPVRRRNG